MTEEKYDKDRYHAELMKNMSAEERALFLRDMEIGDKIMKENREVLKKLVDC